MKSESTVRRHLKGVNLRLERGTGLGPEERKVGEVAKQVLIWVLHKDAFEPESLMLDAFIDDTEGLRAEDG